MRRCTGAPLVHGGERLSEGLADSAGKRQTGQSRGQQLAPGRAGAALTALKVGTDHVDATAVSVFA